MIDFIIDIVHNFFFQTGICLSIIVSYAVMIAIKFRKFNSYNPPSGVQPILPAIKRIGTPEAPTVKCGVYVNDFHSFDIENKSFACDLFLWFLFNPALIDVATIENFSFDNGEIVSKSTRETEVQGNLLLVHHKVRVKFFSPLNLKEFPFDDHRIYLTLIYDQISHEELHFDSSEKGIKWNKRLSVSGWALTGANVIRGYKSALIGTSGTQETTYPAIAFSLDFRRKDLKQPLLVILPLMLIFFIAFAPMTFIVETSETNIMSFTLTALLALLTYRFVLERITPKIGYFTLMDYIYFLFLGATFVIFFLQSYHSLIEQSLFEHMLINTLGIILIPTFLITMFFTRLKKSKKSRMN